MTKNRRKSNDEIKGLVRTFEAIVEIAVLSFVFAYLLYAGSDRYGVTAAIFEQNLPQLLFYAISLTILFLMNDCFKYGHLKFSHIIISQSINLLIINTIICFELYFTGNGTVTVPLYCLLDLADILLAFIMCYLFTAIYHAMYAPMNMLMVYDEEKTVNLKFKIDTRPDKYHVTGTVSIQEKWEDLLHEIHQHDALIINDIPDQIRNDILKYCYEHEIRTYVVPKISDIIIRGSKDITLFDTPLLLSKGLGLTLFQRFVKRFFDIVISVFALLVASPLMLVTAIAIKLEDHGPVFYRQERMTRDRKRFDILKFRSMITDAEIQGIKPATDNDPRITKVGKIIRAYRIDELPQFLNILKGEMSVVGPRPERVEHVEKYLQELPEFVYRYKVKGGLTGFAQIYGKYNTSAKDKLRFDLMYIENYSLLLDIKLIIETVRVLFLKESTDGFEEET